MAARLELWGGALKKVEGKLIVAFCIKHQWSWFSMLHHVGLSLRTRKQASFKNVLKKILIFK